MQEDGVVWYGGPTFGVKLDPVSSLTGDLADHAWRYCRVDCMMKNGWVHYIGPYSPSLVADTFEEHMTAVVFGRYTVAYNAYGVSCT